MKAPGIPKGERERLIVLNALGLLDTPPEADFDALTRLVAIMLDVPFALVTLVDADRQWFKSRIGIDVTETPRSISFCGHVVAEDGPLIVPDTLADDRFVDNPLVVDGLAIRFYAGMPLRSPEGLVLGTLCAADRVPRVLTDAQRETLRLLTEQAGALVKMRRQVLDTAERNIRIRAVFDSMTEGVVVRNERGELIDCNLSSEILFGLNREQILGLDPVEAAWSCSHEDGSPYPASEQPSMRALQTGLPVDRDRVVVHRPDGRRSLLEVNSRPVKHPGDGRIVGSVATFQDVTEEIRMQEVSERISRHERLLTTGTLAAGVGHEINNPLSFIIGNVDFLLEEIPGPGTGGGVMLTDDFRTLLVEVRDGAERIRRIVKGLRLLVQEGAPVAPTNVSDVIQQSIAMAMHTLRPCARVEWKAESTLPVLADEARLTQLLVQLLMNAGQCFAKNVPGRNLVSVRAFPEGGKMIVTVTDNGPGIAPEVLPRIFDPFFTTRPAGCGLGLGLTIAHTLATNFAGDLTCESEFGKGAAFRLVLPLLGLDSTSTEPGMPRILVVDDDLAILAALEFMLEADYRVESMTDPREAVHLLTRRDFDVVLCDLTMPYMTGLELHAAVRAQRPRQADRFVFITGGTGRAAADEVLQGLPNLCLRKPLRAAELKAVIDRVGRTGRTGPLKISGPMARVSPSP